MMERIDYIQNLKSHCTGCLACVDACPSNCISPVFDADGFKYTLIDEEKCISCGKCYRVCPIENHKKNNDEQHLFAAYANDDAVRNNGSSGGIFELIATECKMNGYYVCGAAFEGTVLKHKIVSPDESISSLLKSKYVQSDTKGIYCKVAELLKKNEKVLFCGTPCQVSALVNIVPESLRKNLFTADIICHGVPSQKVFDEYISTLEKKHCANVSGFSFRIKNNRYKHAHGYSYNITCGNKVKTFNGIYTNSSFYNAFKNYLIFRESCYDCKYATLQRVSDITLADFWGIEKYDFDGNVDKGVSMIITNTKKGEEFFSTVKEQIHSKEFPVQYGVDSNFCLTHATKIPKNRNAIMECISNEGYEKAANKYFSPGLIQKAYWMIPPFLRRFIRKLRG